MRTRCGVIGGKLWGMLLLGLFAGFLWGTEGSGRDGSVQQGRGIYQRLCTACHGKTGKGEGYALFEPPPADLTAASIQKKSDEVLVAVIRNGHPNTAMGAWKDALSEEDIRDVLLYVRQLGTVSRQ